MDYAFKKEIISVSSVNADGSIKEDSIEIRQDPLTKQKARINLSRAKRPHVRSVEVVETEQKKHMDCPFCKENWEKALQKYHKAFWKDGFIKSGDVVLFPNKYPFSKHHSVLILGGEHKNKLSKLKLEIWKNAFYVVKLYVGNVLKHEKWEDVYTYINLNFLSPSGASIDHPHMQILVEKKPLYEHKQLLEQSKKFYRKNKVSYWRWLKNNHPKELLIKKDSSMYFVAAFAPIANGEIIGIGKEKPLIRYTKNELEKLAECTATLLRGLESIGWESINLTIMFPKSKEEAAYFPTLLRVITRPDPKPLYIADRGFIEVFYRESVIHIMPEILASSLREIL
jgi:galactose-1-phosphate uridylyltransferase